MTKKALLVGINDYAPAGAGGPDLRGCVHDVRDMANTLHALGIVPAVPGSMHIRTDARATRGAILEELKWLVTGAKRGDLCVFFYSGHGSQLPDMSHDDPDGRDETLCPHDYASAGMIKDDDLRAIFSTLPAGVNLEVLADSCHSGTVTRDLPGADAPADSYSPVRYVDPPVDYALYLEANPALPVRRLLRPRGEERDLVLVAGLNHVLWAACRDNQTSQERPIGGQVRGLFTYAFCKCLRGAGAGVTRERLDAQVSLYLRQLNAIQVPQLEGTRATFAERVFT